MWYIGVCVCLKTVDTEYLKFMAIFQKEKIYDDSMLHLWI